LRMPAWAGRWVARLLGAAIFPVLPRAGSTGGLRPADLASTASVRTGLTARGRRRLPARESAMDVGFIGLGQMGSAIAVNLVKAGHRVTVYNRTRAKAGALASPGAEIAERVAEACRRPAGVTMHADDSGGGA